MYLNSQAEGPPVGRLAANLYCFATQYRLELAGVSLVGGASSRAGSSTSGGGSGGDGEGGSSGGSTIPGEVSTLRALSWDAQAAQEAAAAAAAEVPAVFAELQYKARVKEFMQPRR